MNVNDSSTTHIYTTNAICACDSPIDKYPLLHQQLELHRFRKCVELDHQFIVKYANPSDELLKSLILHQQDSKIDSSAPVSADSIDLKSRANRMFRNKLTTTARNLQFSLEKCIQHLPFAYNINGNDDNNDNEIV